MANGKGPPRIPSFLIMSICDPFGINRFKLTPTRSPEYQLTRRKWTFVTKIHENHQNNTFWNQFSRYVFLKSDKNVTKMLYFLIFLYFFMKMWPLSIEKILFANPSEPAKCLHIWRFKWYNFNNLQCFEGLSLLRNQCLQKVVFLTNFKMLGAFLNK